MEDSQAIGDVDSCDDIILDVLRRFAACVRIHEEKLAAIESDLRLEWGGMRLYVPKERGHVERSRRNERIRAEYRRGDHLDLLARRWGLKRDTVQRIVARA